MTICLCGQNTDSLGKATNAIKELENQKIKIDEKLNYKFKNDQTKFNESKEQSIQKFNFSIIGDPRETKPQPSAIEILAIGKDSQEEDKKRLVTGPSQFDSRIEIRELNPLIKWQQNVLLNSRSVCIIIEKDMIHQVTDSIYQLDISSNLGTLYNLCPGEAFRDQPVVGVGTAFIIGEQNLITASHVFTRPIKDYVIVFGFEMINKVGNYEAFIPLKDIYFPETITYNSGELDITAFSVSRTIDRPVLKCNSEKKVAHNASVYMLGHPTGLPKKAAFNAGVKNNQDPLFFYTSLDAFQGNSGSPVFSLDTHEVIGVLVSGEVDYKWNGSCNASTLCNIPYCKGEKAMRIEKIMNDINQK